MKCVKTERKNPQENLEDVHKRGGKTVNDLYFRAKQEELSEMKLPKKDGRKKKEREEPSPVKGGGRNLNGEHKSQKRKTKGGSTGPWG